MKLSLIIFLSLLIFTGTAKNHTSTEDFSKVLVPVNDEEEEEQEEEEQASNEKIIGLRPVVHEIYVDKGISVHQPEDSGDDDNDDALKLHDSLQSLREYLEMLNKNKNQEEPISKVESVEDNELGPHYHTMSTNEPPIEMLPEELQDQENVGDNPPKDLYFKPIPISDKIGMAERHMQVGTGGGKQIRETVLLAVSSATLAVLLLLTVFCAAGVYYCSKPYRYSDDFSLTSSEKRALFCPSDSSSYTRTESSLLWNGRMLSEESSSDIKHAGALSFSAYIDEISTFSDESARTAERDRVQAERGLAPYQAEAPSAPPPAQKAPPAPVPAEGALPPAQEAPPAPAPAEGPLPPVLPPVLPPAEGAPPAPPPAEGAPPAPPPAEGAPPGPPPAEGAPPPGVPPPAENLPPVE